MVMLITSLDTNMAQTHLFLSRHIGFLQRSSNAQTLHPSCPDTCFTERSLVSEL
jgi:hypothetical protein